MTPHRFRASSPLYAFVAVALLGGAAACQTSPEPPSPAVSSAVPAGIPPQAEWPYRRLQTARSSAGDDRLADVSDLYEYSGPLDVETLRAFCAARRQEVGTPRAHVIAVFDDMVNAGMPRDSISGGYALTDDFDGHLRAVCHYDAPRGVSELHLYPGGARAATVQTL